MQQTVAVLSHPALAGNWGHKWVRKWVRKGTGKPRAGQGVDAFYVPLAWGWAVMAVVSDC